MYKYEEVKLVILNIIKLAEQCTSFDATKEEIEVHELYFSDEELNKIIEGRWYEEEQPIINYLEQIPSDMIYYVLAVMYIGRDGVEQHKSYQSLMQNWIPYLKGTFEEKDYAIYQMLGKMDLIDYLQNGIYLIESL